MRAVDALQLLDREEGPAIRAALNISDVVRDFAGERLGDIPTLRQTYRDAVLDALRSVPGLREEESS